MGWRYIPFYQQIVIYRNEDNRTYRKVGDADKQVRLLANDKGAGGYQIYVDKYYEGDIFYKDGTWQAHLNQRSILTGDDITILGEFIERDDTP